MGKPFSKEIEKAVETFEWAIRQPVDDLKEAITANINKPLYVVGSGGSLSACNYASLLYQQHGTMAKAITPLEIYYTKNAFKEANLLFISASGKNTDILFGFKTAIEQEPNQILTVCMTAGSPLSILANSKTIGHGFDYSIPTGKDGFLATNSLIAFFTILYKSLTLKESSINKVIDPDLPELDNFIDLINPDYTFTILYGGWGQPVAIDIESKLAEAALGNVLLSDYRNFGHGRHHWFAKRKSNSAIIALITPKEKKLAEKSLAILPTGIPVLRIESNHDDAISSIELLIKSFKLIDKLGKIQNIDPGRPGVPGFGRELYNLKYNSLYNDKNTSFKSHEEIAIIRKANIHSIEQLNESEKRYWHESYKTFKRKINSHKFGIIIFDYDGTLCSAKNRYTGVESNISEVLNRILDSGFVIGIATGRGKSVRTDLQKVIKVENWHKVVIGYYNCGTLGLLGDNDIPNNTADKDENLEIAYNLIKNYKFVVEVNAELKPNQLTIEVLNKGEWSKTRTSIIQLLVNNNIANIQILESSHSMDIINSTKTSKLNIVNMCSEIAEKQGVSTNYICIGDKGKYPGNDFQLLSIDYSLSVDEVSPLNESCWNLATVGVKNVDATLEYLSFLKYYTKELTIVFK